MSVSHVKIQGPIPGDLRTSSCNTFRGNGGWNAGYVVIAWNHRFDGHKQPHGDLDILSLGRASRVHAFVSLELRLRPDIRPSISVSRYHLLLASSLLL